MNTDYKAGSKGEFFSKSKDTVDHVKWRRFITNISDKISSYGEREKTYYVWLKNEMSLTEFNKMYESS